MRIRVAVLLAGVVTSGLITAAVLMTLSDHFRKTGVEFTQASTYEPIPKGASIENPVEPQHSAQVKSRPTVLPDAFFSPARPLTATLPPVLPESGDFTAASQDEWDALVTGMLEHEVEQRLNRSLSEEQLERLAASLARLRDASAGLAVTQGDVTVSSTLRDRMIRNIVLLETDRVFREEIGISVSGFMEGLDQNEVEQVSPLTSIPESDS